MKVRADSEKHPNPRAVRRVRERLSPEIEALLYR